MMAASAVLQSEIFNAGYAAGEGAQRVADAELARAAGCLCFIIEAGAGPAALAGEIDDAWDKPSYAGDVTRIVTRHDPRCPVALAAKIEGREEATGEHPQQSPFLNPERQVYFRAGLLACREYMARFVEVQSSAIAASIRANWWPNLGADLGAPRLIEFGELTSGEYGTPAFRCLGAPEVSPTLEALPVALAFLEEGRATIKGR